ncbi:hypothetical protein EMIT0215P_70238 [Pseudomonas serboccidentalis]
MWLSDRYREQAHSYRFALYSKSRLDHSTG